MSGAEFKSGRISETIEIVACVRCLSKGIVEHSCVTNYHDWQEDTWWEICPRCEGEGRMVETTTSVLVDVTTVSGRKTQASGEDVELTLLAGRKTSEIYKIGRKK